MLFLVGVGLGDEKDLTLRGKEAIEKGDEVYLESYTSSLQCGVDALENVTGKKIEVVGRDFIEGKLEELVGRAKEKNIVVLVIGSAVVATTHVEFLVECKKQGVGFEVVENASVFDAVGLTGLSLYKFGRVTTIPLDNKEITSPYDVYVKNKSIGLHTLFLLDITTEKMMTVREGLDYLLRLGVGEDVKVVGCAALGSSNQEIKVGTVGTLDVIGFPQCFVLFGELNFKEEEALELWQ